MPFKIENTQAEDILSVDATGEITASDYQEVLLPAFERFRETGKKVRVMIKFGSDFKGYTAGGAWEDAKLGLRYMRFIERCAVITDESWLRNMAHFVGSLIPCAVTTYSNEQATDAQKWLDSGDLAIDQKLDKQAGVVQIEISAPIASINMEALAHTVDSFIEDNGNLKGLVIHSKHFPGWEDLGSMLRHIKFVKNHHEKVDRVALVVDSALMDVAQAIGKHFLKAEVRHFHYDQLDEANKWVREKV